MLRVKNLKTLGKLETFSRWRKNIRTIKLLAALFVIGYVMPTHCLEIEIYDTKQICILKDDKIHHKGVATF